MNLATFFTGKRKAVELTQPELAEEAGVGLRFLRELEPGKEMLRLDKVNQVLELFGHDIGLVPMKRPSSTNIYPKYQLLPAHEPITSH